MSNKQDDDSLLDDELLTIQQLTQTISVMSNVVEKLKIHLNLQLAQDPSNMQEKVKLSRELLEKESDLQELQKIADKQHESLIIERLKVDDMPRQSELSESVDSEAEQLDAEDIEEIAESFIIEISRSEDDSETEAERVLH
ncbi:MAG: hypothetical protein R3332_03885 [Pseudohongiellaceae bacterium]|nr:hypothetical protein [Pseudohongiellaceae bacterium]